MQQQTKKMAIGIRYIGPWFSSSPESFEERRAPSPVALAVGATEDDGLLAAEGGEEPLGLFGLGAGADPLGAGARVGAGTGAGAGAGTG